MINQISFITKVPSLRFHIGLKFMIFNSAGKLYLLNKCASKLAKNEKWQIKQLHQLPSWCFN